MGVIGLIIVAYIGCKLKSNEVIKNYGTHLWTIIMYVLLAKFMGEEKPQYYGPPPGYMPPPQAPPAAAAPAAGSVKSFFPISNSNRFFRV